MAYDVIIKGMVPPRLINCFLKRRLTEDAPMFAECEAAVYDDSGREVYRGTVVIANLVEYAVIPKEEYFELQNKAKVTN